MPSFSRKHFPAAFWVGLGVPFLIVLIALWQLSRVPSGMPVFPGALPLITLLFGVIASGAFCVALWAMRRAATSAMQSRDALLRAFETGQRWLPVFMLTQTLLVFGGVICLLAFEIMNLIASGARGEGAIKLEIIGGLIALALLWYGIKIVRDMIRFARRKREIEPIFIMGQIVSPEQAPQLWQFVREVAWQAKAKLPDSTVVGLNEGFFVTEHPVALANGQRVPDGRVLYLPLPYMAFLGRTEVAAVVAHELGHFTGEDTAYGRRFAPIYRALVDGILAITNEHDAEDDGWRAWVTGPATLYGKWFLQNFDEAVHYWSRERELAADEFSRRVAGTDATALALLRTAVLHDLVEEALLHNRTAPPEKREGVLTMVRRFVAERGLTDPQNHLEDRQAHPLDSHPSLKQRLDALGVTITPTLVARTRDVSDAQLLAELGLEAAPPA